MVQQAVRDPEEAYVGKDLGEREFAADEKALKAYFEGLEIDPSWYEKHKIGGKVAVPSMVLTSVETGFPGSGFKNNFGTLWIRQQWEVRQPMQSGKSYRATSRVKDVYEWRNRTVVNQETTLWSPDGKVMALGNHHQSFMLNQSEGQVKLRDPKAKEGARKFEVPKGEAIEPTERKISLEMCGQFFYGNKNYHNDKKASEKLGFRDVVVGGRMTMSYLGDLMDKRFGKGWFQGGNLDIKFTNIVWPDDVVIAKGVITDRVKENGKTRANVALWMEKADGTVVIVGQGSALE
ncbi:MAG: hypothetical protein L0177_04290 [Chloroflexi bacterium]|nr:hypothetical protein [Chloroflexota bacterium]